jgi:hypothetical protein
VEDAENGIVRRGDAGRPGFGDGKRRKYYVPTGKPIGRPRKHPRPEPVQAAETCADGVYAPVQPISYADAPINHDGPMAIG